jgi:threonine/homoserine/homoserine lactone efflux protein
MDVASLLTLLLLALALAVQPWSVLAAVLLVTSEGGVAKTLAYVAGWVLALAVVAIATIALYPQTPKVESSSPWTSWVQIASGVALGGWLLLRSRRPVAAKSDAESPSSQPPSSQPKWMARLDSMSLFPAFVLGAFLPNYAIVVAAVSNVVAAGLSQTQAAVVLVLFIVVASAGVAAPLLVLLFRRDDAPGIYQTWRAWLITNGHGLMTVVLAVVAVVLIGKGIVALVT